MAQGCEEWPHQCFIGILRYRDLLEFARRIQALFLAAVSKVDKNRLRNWTCIFIYPLTEPAAN